MAARLSTLVVCVASVAPRITGGGDPDPPSGVRVMATHWMKPEGGALTPTVGARPCQAEKRGGAPGSSAEGGANGEQRVGPRRPRG